MRTRTQGESEEGRTSVGSGCGSGRSGRACRRTRRRRTWSTRWFRRPSSAPGRRAVCVDWVKLAADREKRSVQWWQCRQEVCSSASRTYIAALNTGAIEGEMSTDAQRDEIGRWSPLPSRRPGVRSPVELPGSAGRRPTCPPCDTRADVRGKEKGVATVAGSVPVTW
jgi:hypothetical protein